MEKQVKSNSPIDMVKWHEIVNNGNKSIESQKAYCNRLGLNLNTFSYVRGKLLKKPKVKFAPLTIKNNEEGPVLNHRSIILKNNRGYKLYFPLSLSIEQLAKLFKLSDTSIQPLK